MAVLFAAFYDDLFVLGYLIWRLEVQVSFMIVHIQWSFTWDILWMQISDAILLRLYEEHNSEIKKKFVEEVIIKPVGSQHILFLSMSIAVMHVKILL